MTNLGPPLRFKAVKLINGEEAIYTYFNDSDKDNESQPLLTLSPPDGFALCQFTGLKDAKGQEIFFGDMIISQIHGLSEIVWDDTYCSIATKNNAGKTSMFDKGSVLGLKPLVIGNRWESRETLEQKAREVMGRE